MTPKVLSVAVLECAIVKAAASGARLVVLPRGYHVTAQEVPGYEEVLGDGGAGGRA